MAAAKFPRQRRSSSALLATLNISLGLVLAALITGIFWRVTHPITPLPVTAAPHPLALPPAPAAPPALDTAIFQSRQLFQPPLAASPAAATAGAAAGQGQEALAALTLMGIVEGTPPQAIIAETSTQKSYFVKEGETFGVGIRVDAIQDGRVKLSFQGASVELQL